MKPGTYVSRSVFARLQAENKRLIRDLKIICNGNPVDSITLRQNYRKRFKYEEEIESAIRHAALEYGKAHPELRVKIEGYNYCDNCGRTFKSTDPEMKICPNCY